MLTKRLAFFAVLASSALASANHYRINQNGRILGSLIPVTMPTLFNTPMGDYIVSSMQPFPVTNAWNENIFNRPLLSNSAAMIADITNELSSSRRNLRMFFEMNYVLIPDTQPLVPISFFNYPDESDPSPYPIPDNQPIESWPVGDGAGQTLSQWQHDVYNIGGDRHSITVQPGMGRSWETWEMLRNPDNSWQASNGAKFNLNSNALRPNGWTSGDAAGFPMFPAVVRYDECERGMVEHCMRLVVHHTRAAHIYPATHDASSPYTTNANVPAMGQRVRLKASFAIPSTWSKESKAVALGLKRYGAMVADNGGFFSISVCPDQRFPSGCFDDVQTLGIGNFEVVQTTGATEGPRSANPPISDAGADFSAKVNTRVALTGSVKGGTGTVHIAWYKYAGPGTVTFGNAALPATTATFSAAGTYFLMLEAWDGVHATAYDAVKVAVTS